MSRKVSHPARTSSTPVRGRQTRPSPSESLKSPLRPRWGRFQRPKMQAHSPGQSWGHSCGRVLPAALRLEASESSLKTVSCGCQGCGLGPVSQTSRGIGVPALLPRGCLGLLVAVPQGPQGVLTRATGLDDETDPSMNDLALSLIVRCDISSPRIFSKMTKII